MGVPGTERLAAVALAEAMPSDTADSFVSYEVAAANCAATAEHLTNLEIFFFQSSSPSYKPGTQSRV